MVHPYKRCQKIHLAEDDGYLIEIVITSSQAIRLDGVTVLHCCSYIHYGYHTVKAVCFQTRWPWMRHSVSGPYLLFDVLRTMIWHDAVAVITKFKVWYHWVRKDFWLGIALSPHDNKSLNRIWHVIITRNLNSNVILVLLLFLLLSHR